MLKGALVSEPLVTPAATSETALDGVVSALFWVFVLLLFVGYFNLNPVVPYSQLAAIPLAGSLAVLLYANARADRWARRTASRAAG